MASFLWNIILISTSAVYNLQKVHYSDLGDSQELWLRCLLYLSLIQAPCSEDISPNPLQITKSLWSSWVWDHDMPKREFQGTLTYFLLFYLYFCKNKVFINVQVCMCEHVKSHLFLVENTTNFRQCHCPAGEAEEIKTCPSSRHFHRYICPWLNAETQPSVLNQARQQHTSLLKKRRKN